MPKISIEKDEWYPVYTTVRPGNFMYDEEFGIEVDEATLMRWTAILEGFTKMQKEMKAMYNKAYE